MIDIKVPTIGESITEVTLIKWIKKDGDFVERDEVIAEFESEKATFEVNAEKSGTLHTKAAEGDTLVIGDILATIDEFAAKPAAEVTTENSKPVAGATPAEAPVAAVAAGKGIIEIKVPAIGESITEVTLIKWLKKEGDLVNRDEVIAEFESEKATFEVNAEQAGKISLQATEGETIKIGDIIATIDSDVAVPAQGAKAAAPSPAAAPTRTTTTVGSVGTERCKSQPRSSSHYCR